VPGVSTLRPVALGIGLGLGCGPEAWFACTDDDQCTRSAELGQCVAGYCAFVDPSCPAQHRFGEHAPADIAGTCVDPSGSPAGGSSDDTAAASKGGPLDEGGSSDESSGDTAGTTGAEMDPTTGDSPSTCVSAFDDQFDDDWLDMSVWSVDSDAEQAMFGTIGGELRMVILAGYPGELLVQRSIGSDDEPSLVVEGLAPPDVGWAYGWMELGDPGMHRIEVQDLQLRIVDVALDEPLVISFHEIGHAWLRISVLEHETRYEASHDGWSWSTLISLDGSPEGIDDEARIGITALGEVTQDATISIERASACHWSS
jgi:hypothetical protein